jgi:hypothetical protein
MVEAETEKSLLGKRTAKDREVDEKPEKKIEESETSDSVYEVKNSLRYVKPYKHEFKAFAKKRWFGVKLIDIFQGEF